MRTATAIKDAVARPSDAEPGATRTITSVNTATGEIEES